jgi:3-oxoacyl-[acyl-carrier protein] reductase
MKGKAASSRLMKTHRVLAQPMATAHYLAKVGVLGWCAVEAAGEAGVLNAVRLASSIRPCPRTISSRWRAPPATSARRATSSLVRFLLSDEAAYVNGANVHVSGGWGL